MKKLLSLFAILGLFGLIVAPIYAQEEETVSADEQIVAEAEEAVADAEETVVDAGEAVAEAVEEVVAETEEVVADAEEAAVETAEEVTAEAEEIVADTEEAVAEVEDSALEEIEGALPFLGSEELENILWELNVDEMSKEDAMATTWVLGALWGLFAGLWIASIIIGIIWIILVIIALWKIFEKAWESGWKAIIPIYNVYIMYKIAGMKNWFWYIIIVAIIAWILAACFGEGSRSADIITMVASLFNWIVAIIAAYKLPRKFGWGVFTSILYVIFTSICILILGFGNYKYQWKSEETVVEA